MNSLETKKNYRCGLIFTSSPQGIKKFSSQADKITMPFETLNFDEYEKVDSDMIFRLIEKGLSRTVDWLTKSH